MYTPTVSSLGVSLLLVLGICAYTASGLKCYQCASTSSGGLCADKFDLHSSVVGDQTFEVGSVNVITTDCDYCFKQKTLVKGKTFVTRGCTEGIQPFDEDGCEWMYQDKWWQRYQADICYCKTDFCNSAGKYGVSKVMLTLTGLATYVVYKFM